MCGICSRRTVLVGPIAMLLVGSDDVSSASGGNRIACSFGSDIELQKAINSMSSMPPSNAAIPRSSVAKFNDALIDELRNILKVMGVNPGFQYADANNAYALPQTYIGNTKGTVLIGANLIGDLIKPDDGGISVAGVLAHECGHIFQYFSQYYDSLQGSTPVLLELHADSLAGYYLAKKLGTAPKRLEVMQRVLLKWGTYDSQGSSFHGTPGERNAALDKGFLLSERGASFEVAASESAKYVRTLIQ
jgi:hypothetical protein